MPRSLTLGCVFASSVIATFVACDDADSPSSTAGESDSGSNCSECSDSSLVDDVDSDDSVRSDAAVDAESDVSVRPPYAGTLDESLFGSDCKTDDDCDSGGGEICAGYPKQTKPGGHCMVKTKACDALKCAAPLSCIAQTGEGGVTDIVCD